MASTMNIESSSGADSFISDIETTSSADDEKIEPVQISEEWALNVLLSDLEYNTTPEELQVMKRLCIGKGGFGRALLEKITTAGELFDGLRTRGLLDSNNLLHLQGLIWHSRNKMNHSKLVAYSKRMQQKPLHFFAASKEPENGYLFVKFHVDGRETDRRKIQKIIHTVADILQIPVEDVLWKGAAPFESIIITLMIPDRALDALLNLTMEERGYLLELNIDKFTTNDGVELLLTGCKIKSPPTLSESDEVARLLQKEKQLEAKIEEMEISLLGKTKTLVTKQLETENAELKQKLSIEKGQVRTLQNCYNRAVLMLTTLVSIIINDQPHEVDTISRKEAWAYYKHCLEKVRQKIPDQLDLIQELMDTVRLNAFLSEREFWRKKIDSMKIQNSCMQTQNATLLSIIEREELQTAPLKVTIRLRQEVVDINSQFAVEPAIVIGQSVTIPSFALPEPGLYDKVLLQISAKLTEDQRFKLRKNAGLSPEDDNFIAMDPRMIMHILLKKDGTLDQKVLPPENLEKEVLSKIKILNDTELVNETRRLFREIGVPLPMNGIPTQKRRRKHIPAQRRRLKKDTKQNNRHCSILENKGI